MMELSEEIQKTIEHCETYARELLLETGEAYPFGAFVDTIGNVHPMEMEIDKKNIPTIGKVVETLKKFGEEEMSEKRMLAYALCYEVSYRLSEDSGEMDAIAIDLKHQNEDVPLFYLPFEKGEEMEVGDLFAVARN